MKSRFCGTAAPLITKIQKLFSQDLAKENDFLRQEDKILRSKLGKAAVIIDVNGDDSYKAGHVPGALNFGAIKDNLAASLPKKKDALIVAYCGNPRCGAYLRAAKAAQKLGYTNIKHMSAGISGWKTAGMKTEPGA